ncbi:unnamed protein product [Gongylonema pulchrum]|uniref:HORMA domain-containing protein n=1 Tax=Gongylonema pulchrum TaxID=637853 RepID=A0A183EWS2_9BILA|nr:unnamed protein product [Gongylonema pulchrum]
MALDDLSLHDIKAVAEQVYSTCAVLLHKPFVRYEHCCDNPELDEFLDCSACQQSAFAYQTVARLVEKLCPKQQLRILVHADEPTINWEMQLADVVSQKSPADKSASPATVSVSDTLSPSITQKSATSQPAVGLQFQTATVQEESIEFVGLLPSEEVSALCFCYRREIFELF